MNNTKQPKTACHIRWMIRRDLRECEAINIASFTNQHLQWLEDDFRVHMAHRDKFGMVVELDTRVVGYMAYSLLKRTINLDSFAVHPDYRRKGVGKIMADKLISKLDYHQRREIVTEVEETNLDGQLFLKSFGFRWVRTLKCNLTDGLFYEMKYQVERGAE